MYCRRKNKKGQTWVTDYTISLMLFVIACLLAAKIVVNSFSINQEFEELKADATSISQAMLSEGNPKDWNATNVIRPGLMTGQRLNQTKVMNAMAMDYSLLKSRLNTPHDFLIIFEMPGSDIIEFNGNCSIGSPDISISQSAGPPVDCHEPVFSSIDYDNMVVVKRLLLYNSEIIRMEVYAWG